MSEQLGYRMGYDFDYDPNGALVYYETAQAIIDQQARRIAELEDDLNAIALALNDAGIEHSGHFRQAKRVRMLVERDAKHVQMVMERQKRLNELRDNAWHAMTGE